MGHNFWRQNGGTPAPLPEAASDAAGFNHSDLANNAEGRAACGFEPAPPYPEYDEATQEPRWNAQNGAWDVVDRPEPPAPPPPAPPVPLVLGKLTFIMLVQTVGGMTDELFIQARKDPRFEAFWDKFSMALNVERDHPVTRGALTALDGMGYVTNHADAVIEAWPLEA